MDFHSLTRRELQTLCKKNKIPANMTNVAMADAVKALDIVEGIEEFLQTCESETAQSSIESPVRSEVTSPYVPPTGGRSTLRRNVAKKEPETAKPSTRTQRTTRKTVAKYAEESQAEAIETPAVVPQTNRKKGSIASACRKMDSQFKECAEEENKDVSVTRATSSVTSRRTRVAKEESAVKRVYSTRRSARLAEKNPDFTNKDLFTNDCQELEMNVEESPDDLDEISGITGTTVEVNPEKKDEAEVVSAEKQDVSDELMPAIEEEMSNHSEADGAKSELKESGDVEFHSEIEAELELQKRDKIEDSNDENKSQENDESYIQTSEIEIEVDKKDEDGGCQDQATNCGENVVFESYEQDTDKDAEFEAQAANYGENAVPESEDNFVIGEVSCDTDNHNEIEDYVSNDNDLDFEDVEDLNVDEEVLEIDGEKESNPDESDEVILKAREESTDVTHQSRDDSFEDMPFDISLNEEDEASKSNAVIASRCGRHDAVEEKDERDLLKDTELDLEQPTEEVLPGEMLEDAAVEEPRETEIVKPEENMKAADEMPSEAELELQQSTEEVLPGKMQVDVAVEENGETDIVQRDDNIKAADEMPSEELELQQSTEEVLHGKIVDDVAFEEAGKIEIIQHEENIKAAEHMPSEPELKLQQSTEDILFGKMLDDVSVEESEEIEIIQPEENVKAADQMPSEASDYITDAPFCGEAVDEQLTSIMNSPSKQLEVIISGGDLNIDFPDHLPSLSVDDQVGNQVPPSFSELDSSRVQPTGLTPRRASAKKKRTTIVSDNKENFGSGSKLFLAKERVKTAKKTAENGHNLEDYSIRKLTKMLKEKLQITNELSKNESDNEVPARPALQALPENR